MATTSTLLQLSRVQWNPTFLYTQRRHHPSALFLSKPQRKSNLIGLQIACKHKQSTFCVTDAISDSDRAQRWKTSFDQIATQIKKTLDSLRKQAIAAVLLGLLLFYDANCAFAKSGGSAFSSRSRTSSPSSSCTHSEPSRTSKPSYSYSAPSRSSSSSSTYSKLSRTSSKPSHLYSALSSSSPSSSSTYSEPTRTSEPSYSYSAPSPVLF